MSAASPDSQALSLESPFIPKIRRGISDGYLELVASASLRGISPIAFPNRGWGLSLCFWHRMSNQQDLPHIQLFLLIIKANNFLSLDMHKYIED